MIAWLKSRPDLWTSGWFWWAMLFLVLELSAVAMHNGRTMTAYCRAIFGLGPPIDGVSMAFKPWLLVAILVVVLTHMFGWLARLK